MSVEAEGVRVTSHKTMESAGVDEVQRERW